MLDIGCGSGMQTLVRGRDQHVQAVFYLLWLNIFCVEEREGLNFGASMLNSKGGQPAAFGLSYFAFFRTGLCGAAIIGAAPLLRGRRLPVVPRQILPRLVLRSPFPMIAPPTSVRNDTFRTSFSPYSRFSSRVPSNVEQSPLGAGSYWSIHSGYFLPDPLQSWHGTSICS